MTTQTPKHTIDDFRELIDYNPETGDMFWKERDQRWFKTPEQRYQWNCLQAHRFAYTFARNGKYLYICIGNHQYKAHDVAWAIVHGEWPSMGTWNVNRDATDLRIANIREGRAPIKTRSKKLNRNNTSGHTGVAWVKQRGTWMARVGQRYIGCFDTLEEAIEARRIAMESTGL